MVFFVDDNFMVSIQRIEEICTKIIEEGIEILTGVRAGVPLPKGGYTKGSVNDLVDRRLRDLAQQMRDFGRPKKSKGKKEDENRGENQEEENNQS